MPPAGLALARRATPTKRSMARCEEPEDDPRHEDDQERSRAAWRTARSAGLGQPSAVGALEHLPADERGVGAAHLLERRRAATCPSSTGIDPTGGRLAWPTRYDRRRWRRDRMAIEVRSDPSPSDGAPITAARPRRRPGRGVPMPPDGVGYRLKRKLLGQPLHSDELEHQRLGKPTALAVFASDNLSLERLRHRGDPPRRSCRRSGCSAFSLVMPITIALLVMLGAADPLATGRRSRRTRRPAAPTSSPATTSASSRPRSPAPRCSSATSSPSRCRCRPAPPRSISPFEALEPVPGADRARASSPS